MNLTAAGNEAIPDDRSETHFPAEIMTAEDVARYLHCSKAHVYNAINGKIPTVPPLPALCLGRRRLVRRASLELWIAINENGPASGMMPILQGRNDDRESPVRQTMKQHKPIRAHEYKATAPPIIQDPILIDMNELSRRLSVPKNSLDQKIYLRRIPFVKIGRSSRFDMRDITEFLRLHSHGERHG